MSYQTSRLSYTDTPLNIAIWLLASSNNYDTKQITKVLIRLRICAGWSALLFFANPEDRFPCVEVHNLSTNNLNGN